MEAAALLPVLLLLVVLLAQPLCALYTLTIMRHAASEGVRVLATTTDVGTVRPFVLRRLRAVPEASLFHVGGSGDWEVWCDRGGDGMTVTVGIRGHLRPLPMLGAVVSLMGQRDQRGVVLQSEVSQRVRSQWMEGSYDVWIAQW